jgi:hypothetical protein
MFKAKSPAFHILLSTKHRYPKDNTYFYNPFPVPPPVPPILSFPYTPATVLTPECGAQFTQKLEGMFKDIDVSQDFIKSFKEQRHATTLEKGLHVNVLSQSWWPTYPDKQVLSPIIPAPFSYFSVALPFLVPPFSAGRDLLTGFLVAHGCFPLPLLSPVGSLH